MTAINIRLEVVVPIRMRPHNEIWSIVQWLKEQLSNAEDQGYFGPESVMWRIHREAIVGIGLGRALLLQIAHPWVAQAVADHSTFHTQSRERLFHTLAAAELLIFGSRQQADDVAAHIRDVHTRIHGVLTEDTGRWQAGAYYTAEDPEALLWVLVTLVETSLLVYERCFGVLDDETVATYLAEAEVLGIMIGVQPGSMPRDRDGLAAYMRTMVADGTVAVGSVARGLARALATPKLTPRERLRTWPFRSACAALAAATMPERLLGQYGAIVEPRRPRLNLVSVCAKAGQRALLQLPAHWRLDPFAALAIRRAS